MPKHIDTSDRLHPFAIKSKFRIGGRKTGRAAHSMSKDELMEILANADKARYHNNARTVLLSRGLPTGGAANA